MTTRREQLYIDALVNSGMPRSTAERFVTAQFECTAFRVDPVIHLELPDELDEMFFEHCDGTQPGQRACFVTHLRGTCANPIQHCLKPAPNGYCSLPQGHDEGDSR